LNGRQLYQWNLSVQNILNEPCWNHVTHILMEELYLNANYEIQVGSNASDLVSVLTYIPWLKILKRKFPWIKIFWSFFPCANHLVYSQTFNL
jgi:hypothetical protein